MVIVIIGGRGGVGKTTQLITLAKMYTPNMWCAMELKDARVFERIDEINAKMMYSVDKEYNTNPVTIIKLFATWRDTIIAQSHAKCIVIDGISDLRGFAMDAWLQEHPIYDHKTGASRERESISAENLSAWAEINKRVRLLLEPIMNYALYNKVHLFMTSQMKDVYVGNKRMGQEINLKDWLEYPSECILVFTKDKRTDHYECSCEKAPLWSSDSGWVEELRKDTGLLEVLSIHKLI